VSGREQLAVLGRLHDELSSKGIQYWLFGGWAVDFHAGSVSRAHDDLDIAIWSADEDRVWALLEADRWRAAPDEDADGYRAYQRDGIRLEVALLAIDQQGNVYTPLRDGRGEWPRAAFQEDILELGGARARVISLNALKADKAQKRSDPKAAAKDGQDLERLARLAWPMLVAGTITRDDVRTPAGFNADGLGGSATYFALAARLFAPVSVVATAGPDFMPAFKAAVDGSAVDQTSVLTSELPTYRWRAEHDYESGTTRNETSDQGAYRTFVPVLTPQQRKSRIVFLGSMEPRHQLRVLEQLEKPWVVGGDTMKLYIWNQAEALEPVLERLDYLFLNASEAMALARAKSIEEASVSLRSHYNLRGLVIKEGPGGATLYRENSEIHLPALPVDPPTDPTGAGDAVAAGFLGCLAEHHDETEDILRLALGYAMVMASFAIQQFSVRGLQSITRADVEDRMVSMKWTQTLPSAASGEGKD
jgi:sugar/nucleoside kinase (ribokinase family)